MNFVYLIVLLFASFASIEANSDAASATYNLRLKYLVLSTSADDIRLGAVNLTLNSVGMQFDVLYFANNALAGKVLNLQSADGNTGYYSAIIATDSVIPLDANQVAQIKNYQITFGVKYLNMYTYPTTTAGVAVSIFGANSVNANLTFATGASAWIAGYASGVTIPLTGIYNYPATIINASMASPAVNIKFGNGQSYAVAAFVNYPDGRRTLEFYLDHATWSLHSIALGPFWLQWLNNGLYIGARRITLNMQVDDLLMASDSVNTVTGAIDESEANAYRITAAELKFHDTWQKAKSVAGPAGSKIVFTFGFNGSPVLDDYGGYAVDPLYKMTKSLINDFYYETHTYTHPEINTPPLSYADVMGELVNNYVVAKELYGGVMSHPYWSNNSMITPSISGLLTKDSLRALWDFGIRNVVGDNTRPELCPQNPYNGLYTTVALNGFAGMYIIPRYATDVYYCASTQAEEEALYNSLYRKFWGKNMTLGEIMANEGSRVRNQLLAYRQDPYMFHQANLRNFNFAGKQTSLISLWGEYVLAELYKFSSLPVLSSRQQDLWASWMARDARDACGFSSTLTVIRATRAVASVAVSSTKACSMAMTGISVTGNSKVTNENYGPDKTAWIAMTAGSSFSFTPSSVTL